MEPHILLLVAARLVAEPSRLAQLGSLEMGSLAMGSLEMDSLEMGSLVMDELAPLVMGIQSLRFLVAQLLVAVVLVEHGWWLVQHEWLLVEREWLVGHEWLEPRWMNVVVVVEPRFRWMVEFCRPVFVGMDSSWRPFLVLLAFRLVLAFLGRHRVRRFLGFLVLPLVLPLRPFLALHVVLEVRPLQAILALLAVLAVLGSRWFLACRLDHRFHRIPLVLALLDLQQLPLVLERHPHQMVRLVLGVLGILLVRPLRRILVVQLVPLGT